MKAFCTNCGAGVDESWEFCGACGAEQPVAAVAAAGVVADPVAIVTDDVTTPSIKLESPIVLGRRSSASTYLTVAGVALMLVGAILFFVAAGFPPSFTTTYEYSSSGVSSSTSPGDGEVIVNVALMILGAILVRAGRAADSSGDA
jgi:uncharacterized membrane protein